MNIYEWKDVAKYGKPEKDGFYIVNSTWGVRVASFMIGFGDCFQDVISNQDESMPDWSQNFNCDFHVSHWMELPAPPATENKLN